MANHMKTHQPHINRKCDSCNRDNIGPMDQLKQCRWCGAHFVTPAPPVTAADKVVAPAPAAPVVEASSKPIAPPMAQPVINDNRRNK